jgi:cysteine-rich repeat protein
MPSAIAIDRVYFSNGDSESNYYGIMRGVPAAVCANGTVEVGEQCDDGNTNNGDGCDSICMLESLQCSSLNFSPST